MSTNSAGSRWTQAEEEQVAKYFGTQMTELTLFQRLPNRSYEAMTRHLRRMRAAGWQKPKERAVKRLRVGYLDIETTGLRADWDHMLTWYIKTKGKREYHFGIIAKQEIFDGESDRRITRELLAALGNYDVLWTHWGADRRFDLPYIRTRALEHGYEGLLPDKGEKFIMDTWPIARNKLCLSRNSLENLARAVGIKNVRKTILLAEVWRAARIGEPDALEYIALHNKRDVQLLERVQKKLEKIDRPIYRSM